MSQRHASDADFFMGCDEEAESARSEPLGVARAAGFQLLASVFANSDTVSR